MDLKYKPSPLPAALLSAANPGPHHFVCDPLAAALATLPRLKVVRAQLPAIWNPFLLEVSSNAALNRVELMDRDEPLCESESGVSFTACEGRLPCRGRGRGMSDVAYASAPSISGRGTASLPQTHTQMRPSCACSLGVTPEIESVPEPCDADVALPPSLFMTQAAKHPHLHALILAGRRHLFLARMQARAARVRAEMAAGCVCAGARLMRYIAFLPFTPKHRSSLLSFAVLLFHSHRATFCRLLLPQSRLEAGHAHTPCFLPPLTLFVLAGPDSLFNDVYNDG